MSFDFRNLEVYKKSKEFHLECIKLLNAIKPSNYEKDQLGRASLSIVLNISEGSGKVSNPTEEAFMSLQELLFWSVSQFKTSCIREMILILFLTMKI